MTTVMNACVASWECGKSRDFPTFPKPLLFLFENKNSNKITTKGGEDGAKRVKFPLNPILKPYSSTNLTIRATQMGGE
jgi:hypothetical protein